MELKINKEIYHFEQVPTLRQVIEQLQMDDSGGIAVAVNEVIVPRSEWEQTQLQEDDEMIIIGAVAGG